MWASGRLVFSDPDALPRMLYTLLDTNQIDVKGIPHEFTPIG
jgi:hypothetical protein